MYTHAEWIEFDPEKARRNFIKHGASFGDAEMALRDSRALTLEDSDALHELRLVTIGLDALGRVLVVIHAPRGDRTRIISARRASRRETETYHAKGI